MKNYMLNFSTFSGESQRSLKSDTMTKVGNNFQTFYAICKIQHKNATSQVL